MGKRLIFSCKFHRRLINPSRNHSFIDTSRFCYPAVTIARLLSPHLTLGGYMKNRSQTKLSAHQAGETFQEVFSRNIARRSFLKGALIFVPLILAGPGAL